MPYFEEACAQHDGWHILKVYLIKSDASMIIKSNVKH